MVVFRTGRRLLSFGAVQPSDCLGTQLEHAISDSIFFVLASADGALYASQDIFDIRLRVLDQHIEVAATIEHPGIGQFELTIVLAAPAVSR